jgi:hypothetical protein
MDLVPRDGLDFWMLCAGDEGEILKHRESGYVRWYSNVLQAE